jgi:hypothetical protein
MNDRTLTSKEKICTADIEACRAWVIQSRTSIFGSHQIISMLDELLGHRPAPETEARVNPFDAAAILADPRARRISMSFEDQAQYDAALVFLDIQTRPLYRCADESCPGNHLSAASVCKPKADGDPR